MLYFRERFLQKFLQVSFKRMFVTSLLEAGYDKRAIQEFTEYSSGKTTMIYSHVANQGAENISPLDR